MGTSEVPELRESRAIRRIDAVLHSLAPRRIMTWEEAVEMLFEVREGIDVPEVAQVVGASVSAVKVRAHRGYVRLRQALGDAAPLPSLDAAAEAAGNREGAGSI